MVNVNNCINVSLSDINNLNIIINDDDCISEFIDSIYKRLEKHGIRFSRTSFCEEIDVSDGVVITLDQSYVSGPETLILAPLENKRLSNSDALTLAANVAFKNNGFVVDSIVCGQMGFRENMDGTISERIPTSTEAVLTKNTNTSYVTISFGTQNVNSESVAYAIIETLCRYYSYVSKKYENYDLIYCVEPNQDYNDVAKQLNSTVEAIDLFNKNIDEKMLLPGEIIVNPIVDKIEAFSQNYSISLDYDN